MGNRALLAIACMIGILIENISEGSNSIVRTSSDLPMERAPHPPTEHLQGIVERVTYHAEDSGYAVARLKAPGVRDLVTIVGRFPDIHAGQSLRLNGYWREHPKFGQQYQVGMPRRRSLPH